MEPGTIVVIALVAVVVAVGVVAALRRSGAGRANMRLGDGEDAARVVQPPPREQDEHDRKAAEARGPEAAHTDGPSLPSREAPATETSAAPAEPKATSASDARGAPASTSPDAHSAVGDASSRVDGVPEAGQGDAGASAAATPNAHAVASPPTEGPHARSLAVEASSDAAASTVAEALAETAPETSTRARKRASPEDVTALKKGLASTRGGFIARLARMLGRGRRALDPALLEQMEEVLLTADLGPKTASYLIGRLRERAASGDLPEEDGIWDALREEARAMLGDRGGPIVPSRKPTVILVVGVNGVGKTTTIGKLAARFQQEGKKVVLAAGDTFRAAAVLQLEVWARRVGCGFVRGKDNADPGAVIFDAIKKAQREGADVVLADTAGRLHTKVPLMDELAKVGRTVEKALERSADEVILVLDATSGQNALQQAQMFKEALPVTGVVLTKLDGTAKGGVILGVAQEHGIPVRYVGIGERIEDLREFDAEAFVDALFERPEGDTVAA
jgi:fused signal recognition particle receptor